MVVINDDKDKVSGKEILIIENCKFSILEFDNPNFHTVTSSINNLSKNKNLFLKPQSNLITFTEEFIDAIKKSINSQDLNILKQVIENFGQFVPTVIIFGTVEGYTIKEQVDVFFARNKYWDIIEFHKAVPIFELLPNSLKDKIQGLMVLDYSFKIYDNDKSHIVDLKMPQNMSFIFSNKNIDPQVFVTVFNMKDDDTIYICIYDLNEKKYFTSFLSNFKINLLYTKYPNPDIFRYIKVGEDLFAKKIRTVQIAKFISLYKEEYNQSDRGFISRKNEHIFIKQPNGLDGLDEHMSQNKSQDFLNKKSLIDLNKSLKIRQNEAAALNDCGLTYQHMKRHKSLADLNKSPELKKLTETHNTVDSDVVNDIQFLAHTPVIKNGKKSFFFGQRYIKQDYSMPCITCWSAERLDEKIITKLSKLFKDRFDIVNKVVSTDIDDICLQGMKKNMKKKKYGDNEKENNRDNDNNDDKNNGSDDDENGSGDGDRDSSDENDKEYITIASTATAIDKKNPKKNYQNFCIAVNIWAKVITIANKSYSNILEFNVDLYNCETGPMLSKNWKLLHDLGFGYFLDSVEIKISPIPHKNDDNIYQMIVPKVDYKQPLQLNQPIEIISDRQTSKGVEG
ncbi:hypothetical protein C2G38_2198583 [Gigaspora rosea]|uniref:Uncharacterized protein n=1 Tax=Gigaspora rosea TaxID=44941 RepID=A0A397UUX9_9GLOM|nr:hypothetical protein C2G38_2198583 [Gigaspora rosea]